MTVYLYIKTPWERIKSNSSNLDIHSNIFDNFGKPRYIKFGLSLLENPPYFQNYTLYEDFACDFYEPNNPRAQKI